MKKFGFLSHLDANLYIFRTPIMKELIKRGYKVYAICPKGDKNQALRDIGCEVINYEIDRRSLNPFSEKKAIESIYNAIKDLKIDILHTFTAKPNIYGTFAARKAGVPIVLNLVEGLGSFYVNNSLKNIVVRKIMESLYKRAFKLSNGCVFVNTSDPEYMIKKKIIKKEKVKIIKSVGVDLEKFSMKNYSKEKLLKIRKKLEVEDKIVILMVARAIWDKGVKEYYDAAKILKSKYKNVEFLYAGGTDTGNPSCASEEFLKNGSVKWLNHRDDIVDITAISDIYVLPSFREGLPVTLLEASAMAKPIVTTDTVGCKDVITLNNPLDISKIATLSQKKVNYRDKKFTFITIGRLDSGKNHVLMIEAMQDIDAKLYIIGDGELRKNLELKIEHLKLKDKVILLGRQKNPYKYLAQADCFLFTSNYEGFPNVLLEALACGLPIISTDCQSGPREILAPHSDIRFQLKDKIELAEYGILVPVKNIQKLKEAMKLIIQDEVLRKSYKAKAKKRAEDFAIDKLIKKYEEILCAE